MVRVSGPLPPAPDGSSLAGLSLAGLSLAPSFDALLAVVSPAQPSSSEAGLLAAAGAAWAGLGAASLPGVASGEAAAGGGLPPQAGADNAAIKIDDRNRRATRMAADISGSRSALRAFRLAQKKRGSAALFRDFARGRRETSRP